MALLVIGSCGEMLNDKYWSEHPRHSCPKLHS